MRWHPAVFLPVCPGKHLLPSLLTSHLQHYTSDHRPFPALLAKTPPHHFFTVFSYRERKPSTGQYPHARLVRLVCFRFPLFSVQGTQPFTSQRPSPGLSGQKTLLYIFPFLFFFPLSPHKKRPALSRWSQLSNGKFFIAPFSFSHFFQNIRLHNYHFFFFHNLKQSLHRLNRNQAGF